MIPLSVSEKLLRLAGGEQLPASTLKHAIVNELISEGIILERISGRTKRTLYIADVAALDAWLSNSHSIGDLNSYITTLRAEDATRAELVQVSTNSKTLSKRTYKGFLVNSYEPVACTLDGESIVINPNPGTFQFIYDFEHFIPEKHVVVVGIENMENFRFVQRLAGLFKNITPLFVCRYPQEQSRDLIKWLRAIPNTYLHFGDYDFAGINIYTSEYKQHLGERATFLIPANIEELIAEYGNRGLYDRQRLNHIATPEAGITRLVALMHKYKKCLEQEILLLPGNPS